MTMWRCKQGVPRRFLANIRLVPPLSVAPSRVAARRRSNAGRNRRAG